MNAVAALVGVALLLAQIRLGHHLTTVGAAVRRDVARLHSAHEYAREEHLRILTDVERATIAAATEVRIAAGTVRAITDVLAQQAGDEARVVG